MGVISFRSSCRLVIINGKHAKLAVSAPVARAAHSRVVDRPLSPAHTPPRRHANGTHAASRMDRGEETTAVPELAPEDGAEQNEEDYYQPIASGDEADAADDSGNEGGLLDEEEDDDVVLVEAEDGGESAGEEEVETGGVSAPLPGSEEDAGRLVQQSVTAAPPPTDTAAPVVGAAAEEEPAAAQDVVASSEEPGDFDDSAWVSAAAAASSGVPAADGAVGGEDDWADFEWAARGGGPLDAPAESEPLAQEDVALIKEAMSTLEIAPPPWVRKMQHMQRIGEMQQAQKQGAEQPEQRGAPPSQLVPGIVASLVPTASVPTSISGVVAPRKKVTSKQLAAERRRAREQGARK